MDLKENTWYVVVNTETPGRSLVRLGHVCRKNNIDSVLFNLVDPEDPKCFRCKKVLEDTKSFVANAIILRYPNRFREDYDTSLGAFATPEVSVEVIEL